MERESTKEAALAFIENGGHCVRRCKYGTDCYEPISAVDTKDLLRYYSFDNRACRLLWMDDFETLAFIETIPDVDPGDMYPSERGDFSKILTKLEGVEFILQIRNNLHQGDNFSLNKVVNGTIDSLLDWADYLAIAEMGRGAIGVLNTVKSKAEELKRYYLSSVDVEKLCELLQQEGLDAPVEHIRRLLEGEYPLYTKPHFRNNLPVIETAVLCSGLCIDRYGFNEVFKTPGCEEGAISKRSWMRALSAKKARPAPQWMLNMDVLFGTSCVEIWYQGQ